MYSLHQQQCLAKLGIQAFELKPEFRPTKKDDVAGKNDTTAENELRLLDWQGAPQQLLSDMNKLFPNMRIDGVNLWLTEQLVWQSSDNQIQVEFDGERLITPHFSKLNQDIKKEMWQHIKAFSTK